MGTIYGTDVPGLVVGEAPFICAGHGEMLPEQSLHIGRVGLVAVVQEQDISRMADQHIVGRSLACAVLDGRGVLWLQESRLIAVGQDGVEVDGLAEEVFVLEAVAAGDVDESAPVVPVRQVG